MDPGVGHTHVLTEVRALYPCRKVRDLLAVKIHDAEVFAFLDLGGVGVATFDDVRIRGGADVAPASIVR